MYQFTGAAFSGKCSLVPFQFITSYSYLMAKLELWYLELDLQLHVALSWPERGDTWVYKMQPTLCQLLLLRTGRHVSMEK